jgi:hypothetical protein
MRLDQPPETDDRELRYRGRTAFAAVDLLELTPL